MSTEGPKAGELFYQRGNAEDVLSGAFAEGADDSARAYEERLTATINNYLSMHERAEYAACDLVDSLPHIGNNKYGNALLGYLILERTHRALGEILRDDEEFRQSLVGDVKTDDAQDMEIWRDSLRWDRKHKKNREDDIRRSALMDSLTDKEYSDIAAGGNSDEIDREIAESQRDELQREQLHASVRLSSDSEAVKRAPASGICA